eukprot:g6894.t1
MSSETLWNVRNLFYLGAYQSAINEAQELSSLTDSEETERDFFVYRAYVALKKYEFVRLEIPDHASMPLLAVKLLSQYLSTPEVREVVLSQLVEWMTDPMTSSNPFVALIAGTIYSNEGNHVEALKACHNASSLEAMALSTQIYLQMHRTDKAEQEVKAMSKIDDDATITQLATAWVDVKLGGAKVQEAFYIYQELGDKFKWTSALHNGTAVCNLVMGKYEEAERELLDALNKQPNDPDTLANLISCQLQLGKSPVRYINELHTLSPDHVLEKAALKAEEDFNRAASAYT